MLDRGLMWNDSIFEEKKLSHLRKIAIPSISKNISNEKHRSFTQKFILFIKNLAFDSKISMYAKFVKQKGYFQQISLAFV